MSKRWKATQERRAGSDWIAQRRLWIEDLGLPDEVFATEGHWRYFLDHGTLPTLSRQPGFLLDRLAWFQQRDLYWFLRSYANRPPTEPLILKELQRRVDPSPYTTRTVTRSPRDAFLSGSDRMTERASLTSSDPEPMLALLHGQASERKLRLFACACCRRIEHVITDPRSRHALDVIERGADGQVDPAALDAAALAEMGASGPARAAARAVAPAWSHVEHSRSAAAQAALRPDQERKEHADLLREIFGDPFRVPSIDLAWLTWNGGCIERIARLIYEERRFANMPILADALEEAGCTVEAILTHCRRHRGHVRGCWVVDAVRSTLASLR